ncbi:MAG: lipopolysaccharide biosynthesis protein, partial [Actinomycetota bacterium]
MARVRAPRRETDLSALYLEASEAGASEGGASPRSLSMLASSGGLILGKIANLGLGFVFWVIAARLFPPGEVGLAAGAVAAMMLCVQLGLLGVGAAFISTFPAWRARPARLLDSAVTMVGAGALVAGGLFLALARGVFEELAVVAADARFAGLFLAMAVLGTVGVLLDHISMALRRGDQVLARNVSSTAVTVLLIGLLALLTPGAGAVGLFSLFVAGGVVTCGLGASQLWRSAGRYRYRPRLEGPIARGLLCVGFPNHALSLVERVPGLVLPIVVTELVSPEANAHWYAAWMMAWVAYIIPISIGTGVFAEVAHRPRALAAAVRSGLRSSLVLGLAAAGGLAVMGELVLSILGPGYATGGAAPLRILVVALVPFAFIQAYFAVCRATGRLAEALVTGGVSALAGIGGSALVAPALDLSEMAAVWV